MTVLNPLWSCIPSLVCCNAQIPITGPQASASAPVSATAIVTMEKCAGEHPNASNTRNKSSWHPGGLELRLLKSRILLGRSTGEILRTEPGQVNESGQFGEAPTNPLAINHDIIDPTHRSRPSAVLNRC
jgi:hypothetical protein